MDKKVMKGKPVKGHVSTVRVSRDPVKRLPVPEFITMTSKEYANFAEENFRQGIEAGRELGNLENGGIWRNSGSRFPTLFQRLERELGDLEAERKIEDFRKTLEAAIKDKEAMPPPPARKPPPPPCKACKAWADSYHIQLIFID